MHGNVLPYQANRCLLPPRATMQLYIFLSLFIIRWYIAFTPTKLLFVLLVSTNSALYTVLVLFWYKFNESWCMFNNMMEEDYGWGTCSTMVLLMVAAILLFAPLVMDSLGPPSALMILLIPVILVAVLYFLHEASD